MIHQIKSNTAPFRNMAQRRFQIEDININIDMENTPRPEPRPRSAQRALFVDRGTTPGHGIDALNVQMLGRARAPHPPLPNRVRTLREENNNVAEQEGPKLSTGQEIIAMEERLRNEMSRMEGRIKQHQTRCANSVLDAVNKRLQGIEELIGNSLANAEATANNNFKKLDQNLVSLCASHKDMLQKSVEVIGNLIQNTMISQINFQVERSQDNE